MSTPVGQPIPDTAHAVSVSLPSWEANVGYEEGERRVVSKMKTGYPRFFIHAAIQELEREVLLRHGSLGQKVMLFPSRATAGRCQRFLLDKAGSLRPDDVPVVSLVACAMDKDISPGVQHVLPSLFCVFFPQEHVGLAKQVWQHSGDGISSRRAEFCLEALRNRLLHREGWTSISKGQAPRSCKGPRRYQRTQSYASDERSTNTSSDSYSSDELPSCDGKEYAQFVEERFGRNLTADSAAGAKLAIRRRIARCLTDDAGLEKAAATYSQTTRRISGLTEAQVYLYPTGMSSIFNTHQVLLRHGSEARKSICFGFPYVDTLKILEKWGPGCLFYGHGSESDLDDLEQRLSSGERFLALFTEFPSNPLLNSPNLQRIRSLADRYDFAVVVDETIGNFINVDTLSLADVAVSSLTKIFSGDSNVMGGSAVYNPRRARYAGLKATLEAEYEDVYWAEDAVFMERNSRDFISRIERINDTAEQIANLLHSHALVKELYYPKHRPSKTHYDRHRNPTGGYGGLLSLTFHHPRDAITFFNALHVDKGPSLGTNFTLASPFVILAHYHELDWAARFAVDAHLIRISVGLEPAESLLALFSAALDAVRDAREMAPP